MTAPLVDNVKAADSRNASVAKRASLWFLPQGLTGEANWREFGTVIGLAITPLITLLEHYSNRRGARTRDRIEISEVKSDMKFKIDELNMPNLMKAFGASAAKSSSTVTLRDSLIVANPGSALTIQIPGGANLASVILRPTAEEGSAAPYLLTTDYTVNLTTGVITIVNAGALTDPVAVPEVEIQWSKTVNTEKAPILDGTPIRGQAEFQVLTKNGVRMAITLFNVVISNDGALTFGDGATWIELGLKMEILADSNGIPGEIHRVNAAETF